MHLNKQLANFLLILSLASCNLTHQKQTNMDEKSAIIKDTSYFEANNIQQYSFFQPSKNELMQTQQILLKAQADGHFNFLKEPRLEKINDYFRQYICYIDPNGDKIVYINALCELLDHYSMDDQNNIHKHAPDWKNKLIIVFDGGNCFWQIKINLTKQIYSDFNVNGEA